MIISISWFALLWVSEGVGVSAYIFHSAILEKSVDCLMMLWFLLLQQFEYFPVAYQHVIEPLLFHMGYSPWVCTQLLYWFLFWLDPLLHGICCIDFFVVLMGLCCCSHNLGYLHHRFGHLHWCWFLLVMMSHFVGQCVSFVFYGLGALMMVLVSRVCQGESSIN